MSEFLDDPREQAEPPLHAAEPPRLQNAQDARRAILGNRLCRQAAASGARSASRGISVRARSSTSRSSSGRALSSPEIETWSRRVMGFAQACGRRCLRLMLLVQRASETVARQEVVGEAVAARPYGRCGPGLGCSPR